MIYPGGYKLREKEGKDIPINVRLYKNSLPPEDILEMMYDVMPNSILEGPEEMDSPYYCLKEFPAHERMYPSMMSPERRALWERKLREMEYEKEYLKKTKRNLHAKFISQNPELPLVKDLRNTQYGQELLAEVARNQPRQPETGTGENIRDEQKRDSVDVEAVEAYQTKSFLIPDSEEEFSLLATERDDNGRIIYTGIVLDPEPIEREYEYDNGGRLSKVLCDNAVIEHYQYGKNGERLFAETRQTKPRLFKYGQNMQLLQAGEVKYMYDNQGRMIMKTDLGQVTRYSYLESDPLHEVHLPDGRRIEYTSDPLGRRIAKSINGKAVEKYLWQDLTTLIAVTDGEGLNPKVFSYNEEGDPVSMTFEGCTFLFATNQVGTIFMVADERGYDVKRIIYDSFGNVLLDSGVSLDVCLGFAAGLIDKDTGLVHLGYREYDPTIGRFVTPDPIGLAGGDVDVYGYCLDDPINFHDRTGLAGESEELDIEENKHEQLQRNKAFVRGHSTDTPSHKVHEKEEGFSSRVGNGLVKTVKETGRALGKIGSLAGEAGVELVGEALDETHKIVSPITHPETKKKAATYGKKVILGETSLGQELTESIKDSWNNMVEKGKETEKHQDEVNHKVFSSKWSDLYSKNSTLRKQRAKAIQEAVSPSLKEVAKAYLDTPDDRMSIAIPYLKKVKKVIKRSRVNK
ncbi:RHS repeat-associated core domain-containing protein [Maridesulfovibrio ferrireducens]|uniref:RHS repeat-associated core domain-containing protein n=1 Tax=Maridesulfovibrio ferrireducens TaxID=246191 RepID=A0A1G9EC52_9BACT|nr:RHS repeat-associated core domain-containing protein [Maridesulfovibrio ferrireducens]SDK73687.1 RHS repeat-associated core domain-containing protein [Maridesulfovibrio ferrireducens]